MVAGLEQACTCGTQEQVGVVLAGAGARGAYEAGALSVLLPAMEAHGQRPTTFLGTSAGALNAVLLASLAHLPAEHAARRLLDVWLRIGRGQVFGSVAAAAAQNAVRYVAGLAGLPVRLLSLLDTGPLRATVHDWVDWEQLHLNAREERFHEVAVVATSCTTGRSVVFTESSRPRVLPEPDDVRGIDYAAATLVPAHVLASAAVPGVFPAERIEDPSSCRGWYLDGGVRLNVPIKPAIMFGVQRVVVIATDPAESAIPSAEAAGPPPDITDAVALMLRSVLVDRMIEDVQTLATVNDSITVPSPTNARPDLGCSRPRACRVGHGRDHRRIPFLFVGPDRPGLLGFDATDVFGRRYHSWSWWEYALLSRLLGARGANYGELLSFLFFDHRYLVRAIERGRADALRLLDTGHAGLPWRAAPLKAVAT